MADFQADKSNNKSKYKINLSDGDLVASHKLINEEIKKNQDKKKNIFIVIIIILSIISFLTLCYYIIY